MKTAVIGSRGFKDYKLLERTLSGFQISEIISGGAIGADKLAELYAKIHSIPTRIFLPDYKTYGRSAPLIRNEQIIKESDVVIAFWDDKSTGTLHALSKAKSYDKEIHVINYSLSIK